MERAKMITIGLIVGGVLLAGGIFALMWFMMISPEREELAEVQSELEEEQRVADQLDAKQAEYEELTEEWLEAQDELAQLRRERSRPISFAHPAAAMTTLWYEYREDLPPLIEEWVESTGVRIESGASFPAPPMTPPVAPASGFLQVPEGQTITLTVSGTLSDIERIYHSLHLFPRVVTVADLQLQPDGDLLRAQLPFNFYLIVEAPAEALVEPDMPDPDMPPDMMPDMMNDFDEPMDEPMPMNDF